LEYTHKEKLERWKRQIKELLYESQQSIATAKACGASLNSNRLEQKIDIVECKEDIKFIKCIKNEKEVCHFNLVRNLKEQCDCRLADLRTDFQHKRLEAIRTADQKLKIVREELEKTVKKEINRIEDEKDAETKDLMKKNEEVRPSKCH